MTMKRPLIQSQFQFLLTVCTTVLAVFLSSATAAADPLASWNDGPAKKSIMEFVAAVTDEKGKDYVAPDERIAAFDSEGTFLK
jgi:hypothetical protein